MRKQLNFLERELRIQYDNYSFEEENGNVVQIEIFDNEYSDLFIDGDILIKTISTYKHLRVFEINVSECIINDILQLSNLKDLEHFHLECPTNISDISAFRELTKIKLIYISDAKISDLSPLSDLTSLESLTLSNNKISDINCLKNLKNLQHLNFGQNDIGDVSVLINFKNLKSLGLNNNKISDLSAIRSLRNLISLFISNNKIKDINFLFENKELRYLNFDNNLIVCCDALSYHKELINLSFSGNQIVDINPLKSLKKLNQLNISSNPIIDFSPVYELTELNFLNANAISIKNFNGLESLAKLKYLFLNECGINEVSFLRKSINIVTLSLNNNSIDDVTSLSSMANIKNIFLQNNNLKNVFPLHLFYDLDELDLRGNDFGNTLYVKYPGYIGYNSNYEGALTFDKLSEMIGDYYLERNDYEKALAFCYLELPVRNQLLIYSRLFILSEGTDFYHLKYYFSKCNEAINLIRTKGEEQIDDLAEQIKSKIHSITAPFRHEFMNCLENARGYSYTLFEDFYEYYVANPTLKKNPEVLYLLAKNLARRESLMSSLSIYKELKLNNDPLSFRLYGKIRNCLSNHFAYTEKERKEHDKFRMLLDNIEFAEIPHYDYMNYIDLNFKRNNYIKSEFNRYYDEVEINTRNERSFSERLEILVLLFIVFGLVLGLLYVVYLFLTFPSK